MKASASIIAFAAMLATQGTVEAKNNFWQMDGTIARCRINDSAEGVDGGIFMFQEDGSDSTYVRTCWRDLEYLDFFDSESYSGTMDVDIYNAVEGESNCMKYSVIAKEIGQIQTKDCGKGRLVNEEMSGLNL